MGINAHWGTFERVEIVSGTAKAVPFQNIDLIRGSLNLYHWILGDDTWVKNMNGRPLRIAEDRFSPGLTFFELVFRWDGSTLRDPASVEAKSPMTLRGQIGTGKS